MVGDPGIYLVYRKDLDPSHGYQRRLVGRFAIMAGNISILEDHSGILADVFPSGPMTSQVLYRMGMWSNGHSPYWEIVSESNQPVSDLEEIPSQSTDTWKARQ